MKPKSNDKPQLVLSGNRPIGSIFADVMFVLVAGNKFWGKDGIPHDAIDDAEHKGVKEIWINDVATAEIWGLTTKDLRNLVCDANATHILRKEDCMRIMTEDMDKKMMG